MAYSDFTLAKAINEFGLTVKESNDLFSDIQAIAPSEHLCFILRDTTELALAINTEKARSELLIAPVLLEVRRQLNRQIGLFSGIDFNVDAEKGLTGFCDFIITGSPEQYLIKSPVITIVEAKNENIKAGIGQCVAEMVAADLFNQQQDKETSTIFGIVTTGEIWKFLILNRQIALLDKRNYYITQVDKILGILISSLKPLSDRTQQLS